MHDPKIAGSKEVKASIKIVVRNRAGEPMFVGRSMQLQQARTKQQFKALDGVIKVRSKDGRESETTHKCSDMDSFIPAYMGVSKAILDNVIFCHQEDSNWPLKEGAELKKKFDDIFESTRYSKALQEIHKVRKEQAEQTKDAKRDLEIKAAQKKQHDALVQQSEELAEEADRKAADMDRFREQLEALEIEQAAHKKIVDAADEFSEEVMQLEGEIREKKRSIDRATTAWYKRPGSGELPPPAETTRETYAELIEAANAQISVHAKRERSLRKALNVAQGTTERVARELEAKREVLQDLKTERTRREDAVSSFEEKVRRAVMVLRLGKQPTGSGSDPKFRKQAIRQVGGAVTAAQAELQAAEANAHTVTEQLSESLNNAKLEEAQLMQREKHLKSEKDKLNARLDEIASALLDLQDALSATTKIKGLDEEIEASNKELEDLRHGADSGDARIEAELAEAKTRKEEVETRVRALENVVARLERDQAKWDQVKQRQSEAERELLKALSTLEANESELSKQLREIGDQKTSAKKATETSAASALDEVMALLRAVRNAAIAGASSLSASASTSVSRAEESDMDVVGDHTPSSREQLVASGRAAHSAVDTLRVVSDALKEALGALEGERKAIDKERRDAEGKVQRVDGRIESLEQRMEDNRKQRSVLQQATAKAEDFRALLESHNAQRNPQAVHEALKKSLREQESSLFDANSIPNLIRAQLKKTLKEPCCPTCRQALDAVEQETKSAVHFSLKDPDHEFDFKAGKYTGVSALQIKMIQTLDGDALKRRMNKYEKRVDDAREALHNFVKYLEPYEALLRAESEEDALAKEFEELHREREEFQTAYRASATDLKVADERVETAQRMVDSCKEVSGFLANARGAEVEYTDLRDKLMKQTSFKANRGTSLGPEITSLESARNHLDAARKEKDGLADSLESLHQRQMQRSQQVADLMSRIHKAQAEREDLKARAKESSRMQEEKTELTKRHGEVSRELQDVLPKSKRARDEVARGETKRKEMLEELREATEKAREAMNQAQNTAQELAQLDDRIAELDRDGSLERISEAEAEVAKVLAERDAAEQDVKDCSSKIREAGEDRAKVEDALQFLEEANGIRELLEEFREAQERLKETQSGDAVTADEVRNARKELTRIGTQIRDLRDEQAGAQGEERQLRVSMESVGTRLKEMRNVAREYRELMLDHYTKKQTVEDLEKYYKALDQALLQFHALKIEEINKRISELWRLTYKGGDIDKIEIKAEEKRSESTRGRAYDYRLVMTRGDTELDMRGRCSAGQKVLASLVIRLALAETFSVNCGVLTLDEPTTSIDVENRQGLAQALSDLLESRRHQRNFQLIIITHDLEFVHMLHHAETRGLDMYYRISRQEEDGRYVSKIEEKRLEDEGL